MQPEAKTTAGLSDARRALLKRYLGGGMAGADTKPAGIPKRDGSRPVPLSYSQQQMWLHSQLAGDALIYNEPVTIRRQGELNHTALERSFAEVVRRHEAWRTTFLWDGNQAVQIVHPAPAQIMIPFVDLRAHPQPEQEALRLAAEDVRQPFDLGRGPMYRLRLVRISDGDHRLYLALHHIIFDGVSLYRVLLPELVTSYEAFVRNESPAFPELPIQYPDYAVWQRDTIKEIPPEQLSYWETICADLPILDLKTDHPRPPAQTYAGAMELFELPSATTAALKTLSQEQGATLFMTMTAAFVTLLHGYTGEEDIVIGGISNGRDHVETESLLGCFLNTVMIRCALAKDLPFTDLLSRARAATLGALSHGGVPFELLVQKFTRQRDPSRAPLVQALIVVEPPLAPLPPGWAFTYLDVEAGTTKFDLQLGLDDRPEGLVGRFTYNTDLFEKRTIDILKSRWLKLLDLIAHDPTQRIRDLTTAVWREPELERKTPRLADDTPKFGSTRLPLDGNATLHSLFETHAAQSPKAIALTEGERSVTYQQLNALANRVAHRLRAAGVGPETLVGICIDRSIELIAGLLGILKAGGAYLPIDLDYPAERLAFMLKDAKAPVFLTHSAQKTGLPPLTAEIIAIDDLFSCAPATEEEQNPSPASDADKLAYVIYTSGTTGEPKGTLIEHRNVVRLFSSTECWFNFGETDTWTLFHSPAFDFSVWEIWGALLYGGRLVIVPYRVSRAPDEFYGLLAREGVTVLNQTPAAFRVLMKAEEMAGQQPLALRYVIFGGEALDLKSLEPWFLRHGDVKPQLVNMYGITETTVHVTYRPINRSDVGRGSVIGVPIPDLQLHLLDNDLQPVPVGSPGEIYVGGAGLARGYLNRPELTRERFIPDHLTRQAGARLYKTGDLARSLPDGEMEYLGRVDHQVKIRGFRVELGEIEAAVKQHPGICECVVVASEDTPGNHRLVAYVVRRSPAASGPIEPELITALRKVLPNYMVPSHFVTLPALPRTANGKLDRAALPAPNRSATRSNENFVAPKTTLEKNITAIWEELLQVERVSVTDNFFDLGGHSLLGLRLVNQLREMLEQPVPFTIMFEGPTVGEMAKLLEKDYAVGQKEVAAGASTPLVAVNREARRARRP